MRENLQSEHKAWLDVMYPGQPWELPAAGMVEEAGELLHAILAKEREAIWGPDHRYKDLSGDIEDAIGDCVIYACSLCNAMDWSFAELSASDTKRTELYCTLYGSSHLSQAVSLVRVAADNCEQPLEVNVAHYIDRLWSLSMMLDIPFWSVVVKTWTKVKERRR